MTNHGTGPAPPDGAATGPRPVGVEVRSGAYRDSVALMRLSRDLAALEGVEAALVGMATELNLALLADMGGVPPEGVRPDDLVIAVRASDDAAAATALHAADAALADGGGGGQGAAANSGAAPAATVRTAAARLAAAGTPANVAMVSVPGRYAAAEAFDALDAGLDVLVFSDNVPVEHEIALKEAADRLGRLVMGPDCGTAVIGGAGLGFANAVRPGPVGIVAASGTGAQQLMCLLDAAGVGVRHCLGVGGRDLSSRVAGRSTLRALRLLDADPGTERVVLVSKPPAPEVAAEVRAVCAALDTPVHLVLLGEDGPDLTESAAEVVAALGRPAPVWPRWAARPPAGRARSGGALRGLFCGGTLADEAMLIAARRLGPIRSNIPLRPGDPEWTLPEPAGDAPLSGHTVIDYGDDAYTAGRPHPMVDPAARDAGLAAALTDPATGVVLFDVVLGHGAHPDPAAGPAAVLRAADRAVPVVVTLCGAAGDPQGLAEQAAALTAAGAAVFLSNAEAVRAALDLL